MIGYLSYLTTGFHDALLGQDKKGINEAFVEVVIVGCGG